MSIPVNATLDITATTFKFTVYMRSIFVVDYYLWGQRIKNTTIVRVYTGSK
jgi:hypothetical protein